MGVRWVHAFLSGLCAACSSPMVFVYPHMQAHKHARTRTGPACASACPSSLRPAHAQRTACEQHACAYHTRAAAPRRAAPRRATERNLSQTGLRCVIYIQCICRYEKPAKSAANLDVTINGTAGEEHKHALMHTHTRARARTHLRTH